MNYTRLIILFTFFLIIWLGIQNSSFSQTPTLSHILVSVKFENLPLHKALQELKKQTGVEFIYNDAFVDGKSINYECSGCTLQKTLQTILAGAGIGYKILDEGQIVLVNPAQIFKGNLKGFVFDSENNEPLPYANVYLRNTPFGATTNVDGYFVLVNAPTGKHVLTVEYLGYISKQIDIALSQIIQPLNIKLRPNSFPGKDVNITGENWNILKIANQPGEVRFSPHQISLLPAIGDHDVFRSLQLLPGISSASDVSSGLYIRGGTPAQNLVLYDGMTIYHVDHFFGFLSAFNTIALKDIRIFKGGFPAKYGGRTSGVIELTGKSGDLEKVHLGVGANFLSSNVYTSIPFKGKSSIMFSARRSYTDKYQSGLYNNILGVFTKQGRDNLYFPSLNENTNSTFTPNIYFYDLNGKITYIPTRNDVFSLSVYNGRDNLEIYENLNIDDLAEKTSSLTSLNVDESTSWDNFGISGKWSRIWGDRFYSNFIAAYSVYHSNNEETYGLKTEKTSLTNYYYNEKNTVKNLNISLNNEWYVSNSHKIDFGFEHTNSRIVYLFSKDKIALRENLSATKNAVFIQDKWSINPDLIVSLGVRSIYYDPQSLFFLEPRFSVRYSFSPKFVIRGAWGHYRQFVKQINNDGALQNNQDSWILAGNNLKPEFAEHYILGLNYRSSRYRLDVEGYYKKLANLDKLSLNYVGNNPALSAAELFNSGSGKALGIEILVQKEKGIFTGWAGYTISKTEQHFTELNINQPFPADQDKRHEFKFVGNLTFSKLNFSANWIFASGRPFTAPENQYFITFLNGTIGRSINVGSKNDDRLPQYHRLDLSASYHFSGKQAEYEIGLSLFNVYDHRNVWYQRYNFNANPISLRNVKMLGFTPNLYFNITLK